MPAGFPRLNPDRNEAGVLLQPDGKYINIGDPIYVLRCRAHSCSKSVSDIEKYFPDSTPWGSLNHSCASCAFTSIPHPVEVNILAVEVHVDGVAYHISWTFRTVSLIPRILGGAASNSVKHVLDTFTEHQMPKSCVPIGTWKSPTTASIAVWAIYLSNASRTLFAILGRY